MIERLLKFTENIMTMLCNIMVSCFVIGLSVLIVVMVIYVIWVILNEM